VALLAGQKVHAGQRQSVEGIRVTADEIRNTIQRISADMVLNNDVTRTEPTEITDHEPLRAGVYWVDWHDPWPLWSPADRLMPSSGLLVPTAGTIEFNVASVPETVPLDATQTTDTELRSSVRVKHLAPVVVNGTPSSHIMYAIRDQSGRPFLVNASMWTEDASIRSRLIDIATKLPLEFLPLL
jgi:hypothetical protein